MFYGTILFCEFLSALGGIGRAEGINAKVGRSLNKQMLILGLFFQVLFDHSGCLDQRLASCLAPSVLICGLILE